MPQSQERFISFDRPGRPGAFDASCDGGAAITGLGVVYAPTANGPNPQIGDGMALNVLGAGTTGAFTVDATSLTPDTDYSFVRLTVTFQ